MEELLTFTSANEQLAAVWHHTSNADSPVLLLHHGFTGNKAESHRMFVKLARKLVKENFDTFRFDLYGSGDSEGDLATATFSKWIQNSLDAAAFIRSKGKTKLYSLGFSVGGFVAAVTAPKIQPAGLILWSPIFHPLKRILQEKELLAQGKESGYADYQGELVSFSIIKDTAFFSIPKIFSGYRNPVLLLHGTNDEKSAVTESTSFEAFYKKQGASVEYRPIHGANHSYERHDWETEVIEQTVTWLKAKESRQKN